MVFIRHTASRLALTKLQKRMRYTPS